MTQIQLNINAGYAKVGFNLNDETLKEWKF